MRYFEIQLTSDPKIKGVNDNTQCEIPPKYRKKNFDQMVQFLATNDPAMYWKNFGQYADFDFDLEYVKMKKKANLTDFLDMAPIFNWLFLLSDKALGVWSSFKIAPHKLYNVNLFSQDEKPVKGYQLMHMPPLDFASVDFKKTIFKTLSGKKKFNIETAEEFKKLKNKKLFEVDTLVLNKTFDDKLDLFCPSVTISQFFISERLKKGIEENVLTGLDILTAKDPAVIVS